MLKSDDEKAEDAFVDRFKHSAFLYSKSRQYKHLTDST